MVDPEILAGGGGGGGGGGLLTKAGLSDCLLQSSKNEVSIVACHRSGRPDPGI